MHPRSKFKLVWKQSNFDTKFAQKMLTKKLKYVKECQYHQSAYSNIPVKLQSIRFWDQIYPEKLNDKNPEKIEK